MRVVLVLPDQTKLDELNGWWYPSPDKRQGKGVLPSLGMLYLCASIRSDHDVEYIDNSVCRLSDEQLTAKILAYSPDVVGFGGTMQEWPQASSVAALVKKACSRIVTIYGGPNATARPEKHILYFDYVFRGMAEYSLKLFMERLEKCQPFVGIEGLCAKTFDAIAVPAVVEDLDSLPWPDRSKIDLDSYQRKSSNLCAPTDVVITSRGCPFDCRFCSSQFIWGRRYLKRSAEQVGQELRYMKETYGTQSIHFREDNLTVDKKRLIVICKILAELNLEWTCQSRVNSLDEEIVRIMKDSGCRLISCGFESFNNTTLEYLRKRQTVEQIIRVIEIFERVGIQYTGAYIVATPNEGKKEILNTLHFAREIAKLPHSRTPVTATRFVGIPVSELYYQIIKDGLVEYNWQDGELLFPRTYQMSSTAIDDLIRETYASAPPEATGAETPPVSESSPTQAGYISSPIKVSARQTVRSDQVHIDTANRNAKMMPQKIDKGSGLTVDYLNKNATVIIRSIGERTEKLCYDRVRHQISDANIHIIRERPFTEAVRKTFQIGMRENRKWTFVVDADILVMPRIFEKMAEYAETIEDNVFSILGKIIDKFLESPRIGGVHLYRTKLLKHAVTLIPDPYAAIRPENHVLNMMKQNGFPFVKTDIKTGLHDFEQYYCDIYRKCFIHAKKHNKEVSALLPMWKQLAEKDTDFRVAIAGFEAGMQYAGKISIDVNAAFMEAFESLMRSLMLSEKDELKSECQELSGALEEESEKYETIQTASMRFHKELTEKNRPDSTKSKKSNISNYTANKSWDKVAVHSTSKAAHQTPGVRSVAEIPPSPAVVPQSPVSITAGVPHLEQKSLDLLKNVVRLVESGQNEGAISACEAAVLSLEEMLKAVQQRKLSVTPENFNAVARSYISVCNLLAKCCMKTYRLEKADAVYLRLLQNPLVQLPMALKHEITFIRNQLAAVLKDKISSGDSLAALQSISPLNNDRDASTRRSDIRIALIVSIPNRAEGLQKVIQAIQPQVDEIRILLNGFSSVPNDLKNCAKVSAIKTSSSGHLYASGVWDLLHAEDNGYIIVLDDDIEYPADYADKMIEAVENHQRRAVVVVHGMTFKEPFEDSIKDREVYYFQAAHKADTVVHTGGVGTLVFHTDIIRPKVSDFLNPNFRDLWFSILAARKKVPIVCIARNRRWLVQMDTQGSNLWDMSHEQQWRDKKNEVFRTCLLPLLNVRDKTAGLTKVSIVMSCHNEEAYLAECLDSVLSQTFTDWELLVTDDGSTDRTRSILQTYAAKDKRIRLAFFDDKKGPYVRRNYAISQSRAPFISIQDADDVMMPDKLAILYKHITGDDRLGIVGSWYRRFLDFIPGLEFGDLMKKRLSHEELMEVFPQCWHLCWHGSAIIRKSLFDQIGLYDEQPWGSDTFWLSKAGLYGCLTGTVRFMNVPDCLTLKREHAGSQTGRINPADPRNRRHRLEHLYLSKLQAILQVCRQKPGMDVARTIRDCTVCDFIATYSAQFEQWESEPVTEAMLQALLGRVQGQIEAGQYVSAVITLNVIEGMDTAIGQKCLDFHLIRALSLYAAGHDGQAVCETERIPDVKKNLFDFDLSLADANERKRRVLEFYTRQYKKPSAPTSCSAQPQAAGKC